MTSRTAARARRALLLIFLAAVAFLAFVLFGPAGNRDVTVTIPPGASVSRIGGILARKGVVRSSALFRIAARLSGSTNLKAGTYSFREASPVTRVLDRLERGPIVAVRRITFPEGFTLAQVAERASGLPKVREDDFTALATTEGRSFGAKFSPPANLEGYLFPDTYDFDIKTDARDAIGRMLDNFEARVWRPLAADFRIASLRGFSLRQIVIIASLVEREAKAPEERPLIAGVICNRLKKGMPLQIDATVQYVIGHRERLLYRDLEVDSPYNTYRVTGLPPGPICNPGLPAIKAALHPADVSYLYYTAKPDGTHEFTETLQDHNAATKEAREGMKSREGRGG